MLEGFILASLAQMLAVDGGGLGWMKARAPTRRPATVDKLLRLRTAEDHDRKSGSPNRGTHP